MLDIPEQNNKSQSLLDESGLGGHETLKNKSDLIEEEELEHLEQENYSELDSTTSILLVGGNGNYQKGLVCGLIIPNLALWIIAFMFAYINLEPSFLCAHPENEEIFTSCTQEDACSGDYVWKIDTENSAETWVTSFDLVCDKKNDRNHLVESYLVGVLFGSIFMTPLGDKLGRKGVLLLDVVVFCLVGLKAVFTEQVFSFGIVLFLSGIFQFSFFNVSLAYAIEFFSNDVSAPYSGFLISSVPIGGLIAALLYHWLMSWKIIIVLGAIFPLCIVCYFAYLTESPRYYLAKNNFEEARIALQKLAFANKKRNFLFTFKNENIQFPQDYLDFEKERQTNVFNYAEILCCNYSSITSSFMGLITIVFSATFLLGGIHMGQEQILENPFLEGVGIHAIDILFTIFGGFWVQVMGRRKGIGLGLLIAGIGCFVVQFFLWIHPVVHAVGVLLIREFSVIVLSGSLIWMTEVFPTRNRCHGIGCVMVFGILGFSIAYVLCRFEERIFYLFGIVAIIGMFAVKMVDETSGQKLRDDIKEIEVKFPKSQFDKGPTPLIEIQKPEIMT